MNNNNPIIEDSKVRVSKLISSRLPWLILGVIGGIVASLLMAQYEEVLTENIKLAFFIPIIVYMSDAIGTQTETILVRQLSKSRVHFFRYVLKEFCVGVCLGAILGLIIFAVSFFWLKSLETATTVGLAMFINVSIAPVIAILIPAFLFREHTDPALGAGPITTVIQDIVSLLIYFLIASLIIF